jgi:hypothetical protein
MAGCQTIEKETGLSRDTQFGALGGAAFGGIVAALANANPAWIAASVIMGGVAGGALGNYLGGITPSGTSPTTHRRSTR